MKAFVPELDLHKYTVDDALPKVDQFLYEAYTARQRSVRIIHGKGSGTLQRAVRSSLARHHLVKSLRWGEQDEGGAGVTVVYLAD